MSWITNLKLFSLLVFSCHVCLPVTDASWSSWGTWSTCPVTCGTGVRVRERTCLSGQCMGPPVIHQTCMDTDCDNIVVEHEWSVWGDWSECTRTCGGGSRERVRTCSTGIQSDCCQHSTVESCQLEYIQSRECINDDCIGDWSGWRPWGGCSADCGGGTQTRDRICEPDTSVCIGGGYQTRSCYVQCPTSQQLKSDIEDRKSCSEGGENPCYNGGICQDGTDGVSCKCQGDWRGTSCNSLCLGSDNFSACDNKRGIFHDCADCHRFIICSRSGRMISIKCTGNRIWTGDGCREAWETGVSCMEQNSTNSSLITIL